MPEVPPTSPTPFLSNKCWPVSILGCCAGEDLAQAAPGWPPDPACRATGCRPFGHGVGVPRLLAQSSVKGHGPMPVSSSHCCHLH